MMKGERKKGKDKFEQIKKKRRLMEDERKDVKQKKIDERKRNKITERMKKSSFQQCESIKILYEVKEIQKKN